MPWFCSAPPTLEGSSSAGGVRGSGGVVPLAPFCSCPLGVPSTTPAPRPWTLETSPWKVAGGLCRWTGTGGTGRPQSPDFAGKGGTGSGKWGDCLHFPADRPNHSLPGVGDGGGEGVSRGPTDLDSALWTFQGPSSTLAWGGGSLRVPCIAPPPKVPLPPPATAAPSHLLGAPGAPHP